MKTYVGLLAIALSACTVGQGEVDVSETRTATFPGSAAGAQALAGESATTDAEVTLDLTKDLASVRDLGTPSLDISSDSLSGADLSSIRHLKATIATKDGKIPSQVAVDVDVPDKSTELALPLLISDAQVLAYVTEGPVTLHIYLTGEIPQTPFTLTYALTAHINVAVNGSLSNF